MKNRKIKIDGSAPSNPPKAVEYAEIKGQGRVPYGKSVDVKVPTTMKRMTARGMGAAVKGGGYMGCE
ncbi:MAG: hypothetical protein VW715_06995 [Rhodospirillales bacterium]